MVDLGPDNEVLMCAYGKNARIHFIGLSKEKIFCLSGVFTEKAK